MVYIFSALYAEAQPLIDKYRLKKKRLVHGVDSFQDEEGRIVLSLTGCGVYHAIFAVSSVLAVMPPGADDQMLFYGSTASLRTADSGSSGLYRIAEIFDLPSGSRYYPGISRNTGLPDAVAVTGMKILYKSSSADGDAVSDADLSDAGSGMDAPGCKTGMKVPGVMSNLSQPDVIPDMDVLYDMESSGVYEAASRHMGPDQITILRFISDAGIEPQAPENRDDNSLRTERASLRENLSRKERVPVCLRRVPACLRRLRQRPDSSPSASVPVFPCGQS